MGKPSAVTPQGAEKEYAQLVDVFCRWLPEKGLAQQLRREIDPYVRACVLWVWRADGEGALPQKYVDFYNAVYSGAGTRPSALYWEMATAAAGCVRPAVPGFFRSLEEYDRRHNTGLAQRFVDQLTLVLLLFAGADQVITDQEAGRVNQLTAALMGREEPEKPKAEDQEKQAGQQEQTEEQREQAEPQPTLEELLAQLDELCGLEKVKRDVKSLINLVKVRALRSQAGLPVPPMSLHMVFLGNPGTGKTTVARLLAQIYRAIGVLPKGQLVEVDRSGLVAGYVGQTALKTQEAVQRALGGVLFVDEAYALVKDGNDFGQEAIEVLLKNMEDHRDELIVIAAGYTGPMERFIHANPGLESRFNKYLFFDDYNGEELFHIFQSMCGKNGYTLSAEGEQQIRRELEELYENRDENFGNARDVRNRFERAVARQADRVAGLEQPTREQLMEILPDDLELPEETEQQKDG